MGATNTDTELVIDCLPTGNNGTARLTVKLGAEVLAVERLDLAKSDDRNAFAATICKDRPGIDRHAIDAELLRLAASACMTKDKTPTNSGKAEVLSLARPPIQQFATFPVGVMPACLRSMVEAVAGATGTDPSFAALAALVTVAGCIGNRVAAGVKQGWVEPSVLWGAVVGRSGTTKTAVLQLVTKALIDHFKREQTSYQESLTEYESSYARHEVELAKWKQEQRNGPPTDPPLEPEKPIQRRVLVSDTTLEKLAVLAKENPLGLFLMRDELASWLGAFDRYAGTKGGDQAAWLSMWSASHVLVDRKSANGAIFVERAAVSVLGSIQPGTVRRLFGVSERESGLLARILLVHPPELPALWTDAELDEATATSWSGLLDGLLAMSPAQDEEGHPRPHLIPLAPDALRTFIKWHDIHAKVVSGEGDDDLVSALAKLKGQCIRIALAFACAEAIESGKNLSNIDITSMNSAITITDWFAEELRRTYALLRESEGDAARRQVVELLRRKDGAGITTRELMRACPSFASADDAEAELNRLVRDGLARWEPFATTEAGGRPTRRLVLNDTTANDKTPETLRNGGVSSFVSEGKGEKREAVEL